MDIELMKAAIGRNQIGSPPVGSPRMRGYTDSAPCVGVPGAGMARGSRLSDHGKGNQLTFMAKKRPLDQTQTDLALPDAESSMTDGATIPLVRIRPVIEGIRPLVEGGALPAKTTQGEVVTVEADVFADGHDVLHCEVRYLPPGEEAWTSVPMIELGNDRWQGRFPAVRSGSTGYMVSATVDRFATWRRDVEARLSAGQNVKIDLTEGVSLLTEASDKVRGTNRRLIQNVAGRLAALAAGTGSSAQLPPSPAAARAGLKSEIRQLTNEPLLGAAVRASGAPEATASSILVTVICDPAHARFASWYELFPRSTSPDATRAGTLNDVRARLPYLESLNIDILYLPPIHPIGRTNRKGRGGAAVAGPGDPGSPWAIGSEDGGHQAVHPDLGTLADFDALVQAAADRSIRVALDVAFQCSPDHPWVDEHPSWFRHLPDGSIRYAENPPKRYEDIYPIDFETADWQALWLALAEVVRFWIGRGITVFRVDNPHTKPFGFWQWLIGTIKAERPEVIFLSEAFTRQRVMERLAKVGFSQSYTYFTWRTSKWELERYMDELVNSDLADYFRPNLWPNTPDILPEQLQQGATSTFVCRLVLAATLAASYGIYGPAFELRENSAAGSGSEEYGDSEKYAIRHWDIDRPDSLSGLVSRVNQIRRSHPALQRNDTLRFHSVDNDLLLAYSKSDLDQIPRVGPGSVEGGSLADVVLVVVNLDPLNIQRGWISLDMDALSLERERPFEVHDLLTDARYRWQGPRNFVELDPDAAPAHIFAVRALDGPSAGPVTGP